MSGGSSRPNECQLGRGNVREHIAFGRGAHSCPGGPLARAEGRVTLERFLDRISDISISDGGPWPEGQRHFDYDPTFIVRGLSNLHSPSPPQADARPTERTNVMSKVAVVTGGASGIGGAISRRLAERGHQVAVFDRQADTLKAHVAALESAGHDVIGHEVDVTDRAVVDAASLPCANEFGPVQIVVTSAGVSEFESFVDISRRRLGADAFHQPDRSVSLRAGRGARHDRGELGPHRHHLLDGRAIRRARPGSLRRVQGRPHRADEGVGRRVRAQRHHREHDPARTDRHADGPAAPTRKARLPNLDDIGADDAA